MWWGLLLIAGPLASPAASRSAEEGLPAVLVVLAPKGAPARDRSEQLQASLNQVLSRNSGLVFRDPEAFGVLGEELEACEEARRLSCWLAVLGQAHPQPRYLLVIAAPPAGNGRAFYSTQLIGVPEARQAAALVPADHPGAEELRENRIFESTVVARAQASDDGPAGLQAMFQRLFLAEWRATLDSAGALRPLAEVEVESEVEATLLTLDGRTLGEIGAGITRLTEVQTGTRTFSFRTSANPEASLLVERRIFVRPIGTTRLSLPRPTLVPEPSWSNKALLVSGLTLVAGGVALSAVVALGPSSRGVLTVCRDPACEARSSFKTACDLGAGEVSCAEEPGGLLLLPLAYALVATGGTWALGAWLGSEESPLWLPWLLGAAFGVAAYSLSVVFDPGP